MARTAFCISSYYGGERLENTLRLLRDLKVSNSAIYLHETIGDDRKPRSYTDLYNSLVDAALKDKACEFVWHISDDVLPQNDCLINTQRAIEEDKTIGAIFPVESWLHEGKFITMLPFTGEQVTIEEAIKGEADQIELVFAGFACVCMRRETLEAVGPMDEFGLGYNEDLDWGLRTWQNGWRVVNYRREWFKHERGGTYNKLVAEGKMSPQEPYRTADLVKKKWCFLWGEPAEVTMERLKMWYKNAREDRERGKEQVAKYKSEYKGEF